MSYDVLIIYFTYRCMETSDVVECLKAFRPFVFQTISQVDVIDCIDLFA